MGFNVDKKALSADDIRQELKALEERYGMPSDAFYERFNRGELGDEPDFLMWASLYDMLALAEAPSKPIPA